MKKFDAEKICFDEQFVLAAKFHFSHINTRMKATFIFDLRFADHLVDN